MFQAAGNLTRLSLPSIKRPNSHLFVDGKERTNNRGGESIFTSGVRWDGNRIVKEWKEKNAGVFDSCEGREIFTISDDGKTLTYGQHSLIAGLLTQIPRSEERRGGK